jgi:AhpD family alkylhydroperoxidase
MWRMVKYVQPVSRQAASGITARVYDGLEHEFGVHAEPITLHSPAPELCAGAWSVCRETLVAAGKVDRMVKEAVATAVSSVNRCPFCVDAHAAMLAAGGHYGVARRMEEGDYETIKDRRIHEIAHWALATRSPGAQILRKPPFRSQEAPELISTAVLFHYINRPVNVFLDDTPFPLGGSFKAGSLWIAGRRFRRFTESRPPAGATLDLLPEAELPEDMAWASGSVVLAGAWARFAAAVDRAAERALPVEVRARLLARLRSWQGEDPGLRSDWVKESLEGLAPENRPAGRLALLSAIAPYRVDADLIESYRDGRPDPDLVAAVAWPALVAARRVASWLVRAPMASSRSGTI